MTVFSQAYGQAWSGLRLRAPSGNPKQRFEKADFDALKAAYNEKYGYNIQIPEWSDIFKYTPKALKTPEEVKAEKTRGLQQVLQSPFPEWGRAYTSVMTWIDNIQDTGSLVFPAFAMLTKAAPKIFGRLIPAMGWLMLGYDVLQFLTTIGRSPWNIMRAKRALCQHKGKNPFHKQVQAARMDRVRKYKPGFSDLLQGLQVSNDVTGVGLALGAVMGFGFDMASGLIRKARGEKVTFNADMPPLNLHELNSAAGMKAAAIINSAGQVFTDEFHLFAYMTYAASSTFYTPLVDQFDLAGGMDDPQDAVVPAPYPEDPLTLEVIKEAGLDPAAGVGWPFNGKQEILMGDLMDHVAAKSNDVFRDYCIRNRKNMMGWHAATYVDDVTLPLLQAIDPAAEIIQEDTPMSAAVFTMIKTPILPGPDTTPKQWADFEGWLPFYIAQNERRPGPREIRQKFDLLGIRYTSAFPATMDPAVKDLFPDPFDDSEFA